MRCNNALIISARLHATVDSILDWIFEEIELYLQLKLHEFLIELNCLI